MLLQYQIVEDTVLTYKGTDSIALGQVIGANLWKDYILLEDRFHQELWVFNKSLALVKRLGKRGRGPGEYLNSCIPIPKGDTLFVLDDKQKKMALYNQSLEFIREVSLPPQLQLRPSMPLWFGEKLVLSAFDLRGEAELNVDGNYIKNNHSVYVLSSSFHLDTNIFPWDKQYESTAHSAYNATTTEVSFAKKSNAEMYAQQIGSYKIAHFDSNFAMIRLFGIKPPDFKKPPEDKDLLQHNVGQDRTSYYYSLCSFFTFNGYDTHNNLLFTVFTNPQPDSFQKRDLLSNKYFLQAYNDDYDCVFYGQISGYPLFVDNNKLYILTKQQPGYLEIRVLRLQPLS